ncbi:MAG: ABC transporter permease subunit, partial [Pseudomonadales bacterium]|nr:ABC transporter permease subunit [Pseudomonadales bacterium]
MADIHQVEPGSEAPEKEVFDAPHINIEKLSAQNKFRRLLDTTARRIISLGGIGVIVTLLLLFVFLLSEVVPLFQPATIDYAGEFQLTENTTSETLHLAMEEQAEVGFRLTDDGVASFFEVEGGALISREALSLPGNTSITSFASAEAASNLLAFGLDSGSVLLFAHEYRTGFIGEDNVRTITPFLTYPFGDEPVNLAQAGAISKLAVSSQSDAIVIAALDETDRIHLLRADRERNLISSFDPDARSAYELRQVSIQEPLSNVQTLLIDGDLRRLIVLLNSGRLKIYDIAQLFTGGQSNAEFELAQPDLEITQVELLLGGVSLLLSDTTGAVHQYFFTDQSLSSPPVLVRSFAATENSVAELTAEQREKNFISVDQQGFLRAFNTTANRETFSTRVAQQAPVAIAAAPRGNALLVETEAGQFSVWRIDNPHPDVSWAALWNQIWYEGYAEPDYVWQSSATDNAFEPKYSLVPLTFGTLKAAFYAMLLAAPLAVCAAIYTGYFMAPAMRRKVKPVVELMEALPTVVLGFLAGLWLAPFVENNLLGVFAILIILPASILLASLGWYVLPKRIRHSVPDGWEAALLVPVVLLFGWLSFVIAVPVESVFFAGDLRAWLSNDLGITYDQRNAMVVGFAMGFAVIPTVFSIAEDAIFTVPRHLPYGSLALGATPWQSLYYVVLPTASPGIFSALMIGLGRAVGETMIVLLATGNTPIIDINIFEGMRTLAANIAVEIPESEVNSTHYRILF